jgi:hypothetical protein
MESAEYDGELVTAGGDLADHRLMDLIGPNQHCAESVFSCNSGLVGPEVVANRPKGRGIGTESFALVHAVATLDPEVRTALIAVVRLFLASRAPSKP